MTQMTLLRKNEIPPGDRGDSCEPAGTRTPTGGLRDRGSRPESGDAPPLADNASLRKRFWAKVRKTRGCWEWTGYRNKQGYGQVGYGGQGKTLLAHRASYMMHVGPIPAGMHLLHKCDNPSCVRPSHLRVGTNRDNVDDMLAKNRQRRGEEIANAKLTEDDVRQIRRLCRTQSQRSVARLYGVNSETVRDIVRRVTWKHVEDEVRKSA